jgi:hypothetical protein
MFSFEELTVVMCFSACVSGRHTAAEAEHACQHVMEILTTASAAFLDTSGEHCLCRAKPNNACWGHGLARAGRRFLALQLQLCLAGLGVDMCFVPLP